MTRLTTFNVRPAPNKGGATPGVRQGSVGRGTDSVVPTAYLCACGQLTHTRHLVYAAIAAIRTGSADVDTGGFEPRALCVCDRRPRLAQQPKDALLVSMCQKLGVLAQERIHGDRDTDLPS